MEVRRRAITGVLGIVLIISSMLLWESYYGTGATSIVGEGLAADTKMGDRN